MKVISTVQEFIHYRNRLSQSIALVPTMGNLHAGHLKLVEKAKELAELVIVTIFVNPMQFGANEDLANYPRTMEADLKSLERLGVTLVFTPKMSEIYPEGTETHTQVSVPELSDDYCGAKRPGHFTGVATIVCKLFNLARPNVAVFGQKDYQQLAIIKKMVRDLAIQTMIIGIPTERNTSGLALSSRNNYLSEAQRETASALYAILSIMRDKIISGESNFIKLQEEAISQLNNIGFQMEYCNIVNQRTLKPATETDNALVILTAGKLASTRLIDNIEVNRV